MKSFKEYYPDVIYISGNPYINSKVEIKGFNAKIHFYKVIDVWDFGWDEELGTVPPKTINKITLSLVQKFPHKKFIIHYLQPHAPYISGEFKTVGFPTPDPKYGQVLTGTQAHRDKNLYEALVNLFGSLLVKARIIKNGWELREWLRLPPASPMDAIRRKYGVSGLRKAYIENLKIVLKHAAKLCSQLLHHRPSKRIVITSDHGELLGENGKYSHGVKSPYTLEIPWLRVKNVKMKVFDKDTYLPTRFTKPDAEAYKKKLKEKIKKLKRSRKTKI